MPIGLLLGYTFAARLGYVVGVGRALHRQAHGEYFTVRFGREEGFQRFRRFASRVMLHDGIAFVALCILTRDTLPSLSLAARIAAGVALIAIGVGLKVWAAKSLGAAAYYWRNFFAPDEHFAPDPPGPYRYIDNPMYTVGYLQTYGLALLLASWPGLVASVFAHASILLFHWFVEKPHFEQLMASRAAAGAAEVR